MNNLIKNIKYFWIEHVTYCDWQAKKKVPRLDPTKARGLSYSGTGAVFSIVIAW